MELHFTDGIFVAKSSYEERLIPKQAGFRWNPQTKKWWTDSEAKAAKLADYAVGDCQDKLLNLKGGQEKAVAASRAVDADIDVPVPEGLALLPYQRGGIAYAASRPATLIGDEMGLGKTIQALGVINTDPGIRTVLIICPASLKLNWAREAEKWLTRDFGLYIAYGKKLDEVKTDGDGADGHIIIANYDILHKYDVAGQTWDLLIVDEAHYLKNLKAQRTKIVLGSDDKKKPRQPITAKRRLFLTGTPIVNRPIELWGLANSLAPQTFPNFFSFAKRYCDAHQERIFVRGGGGRSKLVWNFNGASNLEELQEKLRETCMVRRLKADVLTDLPPKRRQIITLAQNGASQAIADERCAWTQHEDHINELRAEVELAAASDDDAAYGAAVAKLHKGLQVAFEEMSTVRHLTAVAKVPAVVEHVENILAEVDKVVIFAHHRDVVKELFEALTEYNPVTVTGDTSLPARQANVGSFQNEPRTRVFIGNIQAAGVGITLTAASHVVFAELDWVPGNVSQAEDRCHRIGQSDRVLVQHLVIDGSIDALMAATIVRKQEVLDAALDDEIASIDFSVATLPGEHVEADRREPDAISPEVVEAVHAGLRALSLVCDGAQAEDGQGFNGCNTHIAKSLAAVPSLTHKQAALGRKILLKYHRQLPAEINEAIRKEAP